MNTKTLLLLLCMMGGICLINQPIARALPDEPWFPQAPPLEISREEVVPVSTVEELVQAVEEASEGQTLLLADGVYYLPHYIEITADRVTLAGASGDRDAVVLDGSRSRDGELLGFRQCSHVTVANLTIRNVRWNGFKINSDDFVHFLTLYNCVIHNVWQRGVKSVLIPDDKRGTHEPRGMRIRYCLFYNDRPKQFGDDPHDTPETFDGNYIGGVDAMYPVDWVIADNVFVGIQGRTREGRGCVFLWHHAQGCRIERNIVIDCDIGIALGNSSGIGEGQSSLHARDMVVRNNMITRTPESGIVMAYTRDCHLEHNTVYDLPERSRRLLRVVHSNPGLVVRNNLFSGGGVSLEGEPSPLWVGNQTGHFSDWFVDPASGNLRLVPEADELIDAAEPTDMVHVDIDNEKRQSPYDTGADEVVTRATGKGER